MSKAIPSVQKYMTTSPHTVGADQTLAHAHSVLREHRIRHLPVLRGGQLVGKLVLPQCLGAGDQRVGG
jgi:acetoin utilization protein AcuB